MQQEVQAQSVVYDLYNYSIAQEFLDINHYKQTQELSKKGALFYQTLTTHIQSYYKLIRQLPASSKSLLQSNPHHGRWEIPKFKAFLTELFRLFQLISEFQIESISTVRSSTFDYDNLELSFYRFIGNVQNYGKDQQMLKEQSRRYHQIVQQLNKQGQFIINKVKKPQRYYNMHFISPEIGGLSSKLQQKQKLQGQIVALVQKISENTRIFQKDLIFLRQGFLKSKYSQAEKITRLCKNSKQSLIEIFTYLSDFIDHNKNSFKLPKSQLMTMSKLKTADPAKLSELIISEMHSYNGAMNEYIELVNSLIGSLTNIGGQAKYMRIKQMELIQGMNKYYEYDQCNIGDVTTVLNLYNIFIRDLGELGDNLVFSVNNFIQLQKKVNKCSEMTLTLVKCSPERKASPKNSKRKLSFSETQQPQASTHKYLDILNEQLSPTYIQNILSKIFRDFEDTMVKIRDAFLVVQPNKRRATEDSMSISYISEVSRPVERKPSRFQHWLWKNCKQEIEKGFRAEENCDQILKQLTSLSALSKNQDKEVETLNCILVNKKLQGVLKLYTKGLQFQSNDHSMTLFIPLNDVEKVDLELSIISKTLIVETSVGILKFTDVTEGGVKKFYVSIEKAIDNFNQQNVDSPAQTNKVTFSEQELGLIKKRKDEIEKQLQPLGDYEHVKKIILNDIDIEVFYKVVYSGEPVNISGKDYPNFAAFMSKKYNNFNDIFFGYDKPGPKFYSGNQDVTFFNCPLYSQRIIEYDHYLPKIPFMPESCHNKQTVRVYWISNEELHIRDTNVTTKAPFTQNFYVVGLTIIKQINSDVQANYYMKLVELNDFAMKGMVYKTSKEEFRKGVDIMTEQFKRVMAKYKKKANAKTSAEHQPQNHEDSLASDKTKVKQFKNTIQKLENKNKQLQYILVAVFILNIVLFYYF